MHSTRSLIRRYLRPRPSVPVSRWADSHRVLSGKSSSEPGPWRTSRHPLLRAVMDDLSEHSSVQRVVVMKPAQTGATEVAVNWIGYVMGHVRTAKPMLIVVPTDKLLVRWVHQRLRPMIEGAKTLRDLHTASKSRDGSNRLDLIDYPGGLLILATAGSASNLKSDSIRFVVADEVDEFGWDVGGMGDPFGLIESRMSTFPRRKLLMISTPSVKGASRIEQEYADSDQRTYHVPCPHCGEHQPLRWENLIWDRDAEQAWYACAANGCRIDERDKPAMLIERSDRHPDGARWISANPQHKTHGYQWNALYSPLGLGYSWAELARQWLRAQGDNEKLQQFTNERLGRPWEDRRTAVRDDHLAQRAEPWPLRAVQPGVLLITAGIDTQDDRYEVQLIGWGEHKRWWVIDYRVIHGDPGLAATKAALADYLARPLESAAGAPMRVEASAIDMGGHKTEDVKDLVRSSRLPNLIAILGSRHRIPVVLGRPHKTDYRHNGRIVKHGFAYYPVGTEVAKDRLYADLRHDTEADDPAERIAHFSDQLEAEQPGYYQGLLSEVWNPKRQRYERKRGGAIRNEPIDTWVYAFAAAHHPNLRLDRMRPIDWRRRRDRYEPGADSSAAAPQPQTEPPPQPTTKPQRPNPQPARGFGKEGWTL